MKRSAGILPFRIKNGSIEVYLGHFGGPFWSKKERSWGVIKGEVQESESDLEAAKREFYEETGKRVDGDFIDLGEFRTSNKILHIYALQTDLDTHISSNKVTITYYGKELQIPEIDRAAWMRLDEAKAKIVKSQGQILDKLEQTLQKSRFIE
ncbi:NUDIX domain-containing protein [Nitratiruptor sp. YY09-18]|uniref:NUDIX domain-containing protein n=1 Tax=Nitratiruptor sp. YY09-18 TaxID=2724901 RepID=UPI0019150C56|nr:NUDIX domain-containing protein [Nitratiruptor sp. YY09-18]BCD68826.1 hypothetical protein NitYY0918_C1745 [Nitratiruptor sp. YY09-18]